MYIYVAITENSISKIKIGSKLSKRFEVFKGLRQGCSLSPALFKIYVHEVLRI